MSLPDFVIIGAMKCGTSTLHAQLAAQPQFFMSEPKEPNFFSDDDVFTKGADWYQSLFAAAPEGAIKGEASTHYTKLPTYPQTIERLFAAIPNAKFIYVVRDPIDRLVSHYIHEWSTGIITCPIDEAVERHTELIDYSRYAYQLEPWIARFGKDRILTIVFEEMTASPDAVIKRIAAFLGAAGGVSWTKDLDAQNVSSERIRKFPGYSMLVENAAAAALRRALVPRSLRDRIKRNFQMRERPALSDAVQSGLAETFNRDLEALAVLTGLALRCGEFGHFSHTA